MESTLNTVASRRDLGVDTAGGTKEEDITLEEEA